MGLWVMIMPGREYEEGDERALPVFYFPIDEAAVLWFSYLFSSAHLILCAGPNNTGHRTPNAPPVHSFSVPPTYHLNDVLYSFFFRRCYEANEVIRQETRLWDEKKKATQIMRVKEGERQ